MLKVSEIPGFSSAFGKFSCLADKTFRPLARRRLITCRPPRVDILTRNPIFLPLQFVRLKVLSPFSPRFGLPFFWFVFIINRSFWLSTFLPDSYPHSFPRRFSHKFSPERIFSAFSYHCQICQRKRIWYHDHRLTLSTDTPFSVDNVDNSCFLLL